MQLKQIYDKLLNEQKTKDRAIQLDDSYSKLIDPSTNILINIL